MKSRIFTLALLLLFSVFSFRASSQCVPMTAEECPDPENNGQVCPDSLDVAFVNQLYSQVATIKPPAVFITEDSLEIDLLHVKLMELGNLPEGLSWQSNTDDSIFVAGEYYCVLMEGTPVTVGEYDLRIVVDVYISFFGVPVNVATVIDSTSLSMSVVDNSGLTSNSDKLAFHSQIFPNPFTGETSIEFYTDQDDQVTFEVYNLLGKRVFTENMQIVKGNVSYKFDGRVLSPGSYFYRLNTGDYYLSGIMIRAD